MNMLSESVAVTSLLQQGIDEPYSIISLISNIFNKSTLFQTIKRNKQTNKQKTQTTTKSSLARNGKSPLTVLLKIIHYATRSYIFREILHPTGENCFPIM